MNELNSFESSSSPRYLSFSNLDPDPSGWCIDDHVPIPIGGQGCYRIGGRWEDLATAVLRWRRHGGRPSPVRLYRSPRTNTILQVVRTLW
jgi:hypothetical protein